MFSTFNIDIIEQCQYYTGYLPVKHSINLKCLRFIKSLSQSHIICKPAGLLFNWLGGDEYSQIAQCYNILPSDGHFAMNDKVWSKFKAELCLLDTR